MLQVFFFEFFLRGFGPVADKVANRGGNFETVDIGVGPARPKFANVFMGRNGGFVKNNGWGTGENVGEKATLASQRTLRRL